MIWPPIGHPPMLNTLKHWPPFHSLRVLGICFVPGIFIMQLLSSKEDICFCPIYPPTCSLTSFKFWSYVSISTCLCHTETCSVLKYTPDPSHSALLFSLYPYHLWTFYSIYLFILFIIYVLYLFTKTQDSQEVLFTNSSAIDPGKKNPCSGALTIYLCWGIWLTYTHSLSLDQILDTHDSGILCPNSLCRPSKGPFTWSQTPHQGG